MLVRIISAIVALLILLPVLWFSDSFLLPCASAVVAIISLFEMFGCLKVRRNLWISVPFYLVAAFAPFAMRYMQDRHLMLACFAACIGVLALIMFTASVLSHRKLPTSQTASVYMTAMYIIAAFTSIVYVRDSSNNGQFLLIMMFAAPWVTDTFAYFFGRAFGKHKLIPDVSPKKTIEGSVAGIICCTLAILGYAFVCSRVWGVQCNYVILAALGVLLSIVGQIGDLAMSVIKREYNIKDYGKIMPGHGGALDRFDSVLAVAIVLAAAEVFVDVFA